MGRLRLGAGVRRGSWRRWRRCGDGGRSAGQESASVGRVHSMFGPAGRNRLAGTTCPTSQVSVGPSLAPAAGHARGIGEARNATQRRPRKCTRGRPAGQSGGNGRCARARSRQESHQRTYDEGVVRFEQSPEPSSPILPAYTIYVDEAGSPEFRRVPAGSPLPAYVTCGVVVPVAETEAVLAILPRDPESGAFIKSSHPKMSPPLATSTIDRLLRRDIDVALVTVDQSGEKSIASITREHAERKATHERDRLPRMAPSILGYAKLTSRAILEAWKQAMTRRDAPLSFVDLVFDNASLSPQHRAELRRHYMKQSLKQLMHVRNVTWRSHVAEPLIGLPDLFAGVMHRQGTRGDCAEACRLLLQAVKAGQNAHIDAPKFPGRKQRAELRHD